MVARLIVKRKGEDAAEALQHALNLLVHGIAPLFHGGGAGGEAAVQRQYHFAVAARLELIFTDIATTDLLMVVYFAVDRQHLLAVGREERLPSALGIDDAQSLVCQDGTAATVDARPVRSAVTQFLAHAQRLLAQLWRLTPDSEDRYDSTHNIKKKIYSTVTLFARLRGRSTSLPLQTAM